MAHRAPTVTTATAAAATDRSRERADATDGFEGLKDRHRPCANEVWQQPGLATLFASEVTRAQPTRQISAKVCPRTRRVCHAGGTALVLVKALVSQRGGKEEPLTQPHPGQGRPVAGDTPPRSLGGRVQLPPHSQTAAGLGAFSGEAAVQRLKNLAVQQNDHLHLTEKLHPQQTFPDDVEDIG